MKDEHDNQDKDRGWTTETFRKVDDWIERLGVILKGLESISQEKEYR